MFAIQTLIIVGGVTKAIPLTGITLPFVSYGGSSVVGNFILAGLLLLVSERAGRREAEGLAYKRGPWGSA
jgi:cell division protein FtsW (lipid II flippase)